MPSFPLPEIVDNLILRLENCKECPHPELEAVGCPGIWIKDYDVFAIRRVQELHAALLDAARIASEVAKGDKFIHIEPTAGVFLRLPPCVLKALAEADCTVELDVEEEED